MTEARPRTPATRFTFHVTSLITSSVFTGSPSLFIMHTQQHLSCLHAVIFCSISIKKKFMCCVWICSYLGPAGHREPASRTVERQCLPGHGERGLQYLLAHVLVGLAHPLPDARRPGRAATNNDARIGNVLNEGRDCVSLAPTQPKGEPARDMQLLSEHPVLIGDSSDQEF
jgi:hypothetical protein